MVSTFPLGHHEATSPSAMANTASHQAAAAHMAAVMSQNPNLEAYWPKMDPYAGHHDRTVRSDIFTSPMAPIY